MMGKIDNFRANAELQLDTKINLITKNEFNI